jgi:hypothetical protein
MRLRLFDRFRRAGRRGRSGRSRARGRADGPAGLASQSGSVGSHRRVAPPRLAVTDRSGLAGRASGPGARPGGAGVTGATVGMSGAAARTAGHSAAVIGQTAGMAGPDQGVGVTAPRTAGPRTAGTRRASRSAGGAESRLRGAARAATRAGPQATVDAGQLNAAAQARKSARTAAARLPWYEVAQSNRTAAGRRHCGRLEEVVRREWAVDAIPPPEAVRAIDRLADLPTLIKERLAAGLDAIYVGPGGVPDLDDMGRLSGVPLPSGRATWDACAGAYGERKIIVGSRPSPTPDVMCHEIGHALDDIDGSDGQWQSDSDEFRALYEQCLPSVQSDFHRQRGLLGRREFFADAFAAIASSQRPALVDMLGGDTRAALNVMLYFNVRYGI